MTCSPIARSCCASPQPPIAAAIRAARRRHGIPAAWQRSRKNVDLDQCQIKKKRVGWFLWSGIHIDSTLRPRLRTCRHRCRRYPRTHISVPTYPHRLGENEHSGANLLPTNALARVARRLQRRDAINECTRVANSPELDDRMLFLSRCASSNRAASEQPAGRTTCRAR
jgi:hypothetical protein